MDSRSCFRFKANSLEFLILHDTSRILYNQGTCLVPWRNFSQQFKLRKINENFDFWRSISQTGGTSL